MKQLQKSLIAIIVFALLITLCACKNEDKQPETSSDETNGITGATSVKSDETLSLGGELTITFDYEKISGWATNQFAVWIEDTDGNYINTLYATKWTANGGYKSRPDSIKIWVKKSGVDSMQKSAVDAISGATPKAGKLSYSWDLTYSNGETVPQGEYMFFVEGTLRWQNHVVYSGVIEIGDNAVTVTAEAEYFFEESGDNPALNEDSLEVAMISGVVAVFEPGLG